MMITYNDKEYDVPSMLFIEDDMEGGVTLLSEEEVLALIDRVYKNVANTLTDKFLSTIYEANYLEAREKFEIPQVPHFGDFNMVQRKRIEYIIAEKRKYQSQPVPSEIEGKVYHFYGGLENVRKYKEAFDLATSLGLAKGRVGVVEGIVEIGQEDMDKAIKAIGLQVYRGWLKSAYYTEAILSTKKPEQINAVMWQDKRSN